ncbi:MAG: AMP-binding protein [Deltaproteobacteria bacterium]|nr:AMP-binding protein [Deltaproteobacteria bacterium]
MNREQSTKQQQTSDAAPGGPETANLPVLLGQAANLNELLDISCSKYADLGALGMALEQPLTYQQLHDRVLVLAAYLRSCGVKFGDRVTILAENSHNWGTVYLAVVRLGAVCVPILPDLPEADVHHILGEMECDIIFLTQRQIEKVYDLEPKIGRVVTLDDYSEESGIIEVTPFSQFLAESQDEFAVALQAGILEFPEVDGDHLASILYTSGTSGFSKAVMLSHSNLCANAFSASNVIVIPPGAVFLSVLPVSHTYEFTVGLVMPLIKGGCVLYAGKTPTPMVLQKLCGRERPHVMLVVPLIMEKIYKKRVLPAVEKSKMLSLLCRFTVGRRLVYRKIGAKLLTFFGGRLEVMGIGGAALNPEVEIFLRDAGFPFLVGYGLTETSPLIAGGPNKDNTIRLGSAGKPVPGVEVHIDDPDPKSGIGEIFVRGPNIMQGYWQDPEVTAETFTDDGWLKTGDLGRVDELGNLHIKGRSKSVIVLANGENVYPEAIEHKLNAYPFVVESLVIENRNMLEAWIYPDYEFVDAQTQGQSRQQRYGYITAELDRIRKEVNGQLGSMSRLSRVLERREPFIKTATHKIKRYLYSADSMTL